MKSLLSAFLALTILVAGFAYAGDVYVRGYFRKNGTYVAPHYRSAPDGNFYNNWSTKGNINPYTGKPGTKVTPPSGYSSRSYGSLADYYRSTPLPSGGSSATLPDIELPVLEGILDDSEVARSVRYCGRLYKKPSDNERCINHQAVTLARVALPDYSSLPQEDAARSTRYCERLYGDNRAGFYNCVNHQYFGIREPVRAESGLPESEINRSRRYCERLYSDNRAGFNSCFEHQQNSLSRDLQLDTSSLPEGEWTRSNRYCERLYGDNRGGAATCKKHQATTLARRYSDQLRNSPDSSYCERLYSDNRAGYWNCVRN